MFKAPFYIAVVFVSTGAWFATDACGEVLRESDVSTIAGTLNKANDPEDAFTFRSFGNQILIADLDAEVYIPTAADHGTVAGGCEGESGTVVTPTSGCEGGDTGCSDSGPGRFRLELFKDSSPMPICSAGKPARPGWDRDPRFACHLADPGDYLLRVSIVAEGESESMSGTAKTHVYVLSVSLRDLPKNALLSEEAMSKALTRSINRLRVDDDNQR